MAGSPNAVPGWDDTTGYSSVFNGADTNPNATVDWGPIQLPHASLLASSDLPPLNAARIAALRFPDGDLIIKLTPSPEEWLLVHRSVVAVGMPLLEPQLREPWAHPEIVRNTATGTDVEVYTLVLKYGDETLFLGGEHLVDFKQDPFIVPFPLSKLAPSKNGWPLKGDHGSPLAASIQDTANQHLALVSAVYAHHVSGPSLKREDVFIAQHHYGIWNAAEYLNEDIPHLSHLLAYAYYYGALVEVTTQICDLLSSFPQLPDAMSLKPVSWLRLGIKMHSKKIYCEALRHLITGHRYSWKVIGHELGMTAEQTVKLFRPRIDRLKAIEQGLLDVLGDLVLVKPKLWFTCDELWEEDMSLEELSSNPTILYHLARAFGRHDFMARGTFGGWMAKKKMETIMAHSMGWIQRKMPTATIALRGFCAIILEQDISDEARTVCDHELAWLCMTYSTVDGDVEPYVWNRIKLLLDEACSHIRQTYHTHEEQQADGTILTYRCSFFDECNELVQSQFPYLALDEEDVPWQEMQSLVTSGASGALQVSLEPATREVLRVCGLRTAEVETLEEIFEDATVMHI